MSEYDTDMQRKLVTLRSAAFDKKRTTTQLRVQEWETLKTEVQKSRQAMISQCRKAQRWEYDLWLRGYMENGGVPTHFYDYPMPTMWVALTDLKVCPLYGSASMDIIVPLGITEDGGSTGHSNLFVSRSSTNDSLEYVQRGFHQVVASQPKFAPVYSDTDVS